MDIKWREEFFVLVVMVAMVVWVPVLFGDQVPSRRSVTWFALGWVVARASALLFASRRRRGPSERP